MRRIIHARQNKIFQEPITNPDAIHRPLLDVINPVNLRFGGDVGGPVDFLMPVERLGAGRTLGGWWNAWGLVERLKMLKLMAVSGRHKENVHHRPPHYHCLSRHHRPMEGSPASPAYGRFTGLTGLTETTDIIGITETTDIIGIIVRPMIPWHR